MNSRHIITLISVFLSVTSALLGSPVRDAHAVYTQPDGTTFRVRLNGDEWTKLSLTEDGCAIIRENDGWWCYGTYDTSGALSSTGYRIGDQAPSHITEASRQIPYEILAQRARERRVPGARYGVEHIEAIREQAKLTKAGDETVRKKGIALLVEFSDVKFRYTRNDFNNLLNQPEYKGTGSAKDYFEYQFGDGWEFSFDVSDIVTLSWPAKRYGANDSDKQDARPWDMVAEACRAVDDDIDFSIYDQDNDGMVDNVYVFYAGLSESEHTDQPDLIWPHQYYIYSGRPRIDLILDGKRIDRYACSSEISGERSLTGIGSFCHEYSHTLGLMDLYDTDYDNDGGWAAGTWRSTSLMDGGNYNNNSATPPNFNCIEREMLGLSEPVRLVDGQSYTLSPIHKEGLCYKLETDIEGEYYLFECRSNEGWDRYIGGKGMLVYHIDRNATEMSGGHRYNKWELNTVNADLSHQCADLIEADGRSDEITTQADLKTDISGIFFPYENVTSITPTGTPALKFWSGVITDTSVTGIEASGDNISFNVVQTGEIPEIPSVTDVSVITLPEAAVIRFRSSDTSLEGLPVLQWRKSGSESYSTAEISEYSPGRYACLLDGLEGGHVSYEVVIRFHSEGSIGEAVKRSFMTKRASQIDWPYIFITSAQVAASEGIILYVANASDAAETEWTYDGAPISPGTDYMFHPEKDGILKAEVIWKDGSKDIIIKEIKVIKE